MNRKRKQKIISLLLVALIIVTGVKQVVYADESMPTVHTATDYTSFKEALFYAMDGDTILIMGSVAVKSDIDIGSTEKI